MDRFRVKALEKLFFDLSEVGKVKTLLPRANKVGEDASEELLKRGCEADKDEELVLGYDCVGKVKTLLPRCDGTQTLVWAKLLLKKELLKKYTLLLKGAIKYDKIEDIKEYKEKIKLYE
jgi:hypothetical protein